MVVWEAGRMKKSDYRKFIIRGEATVEGEAAQPGGLLRDDFASMREAVGTPLPPRAGGKETAAQPDSD